MQWSRLNVFEIPSAFNIFISEIHCIASRIKSNKKCNFDGTKLTRTGKVIERYIYTGVVECALGGLWWFEVFQWIRSTTKHKLLAMSPHIF